MAVPEGYREFVAEHTPVLYRTAFLLSHDREAAESLLNRTAKSLLKQYKHRTSDAECAEWARLYVYRLFLDDSARKNHQEAPAENAGDQSGEAFIARRLAALSPFDRAVAVHAVLDDCSSRRVATDLGCTTSDVRQALAAFSALGSARPDAEAPRVSEEATESTEGRGLIPLAVPRRKRSGSLVEIRHRRDERSRRQGASAAAAENSPVGSAAQIGLTWVQGDEPGSRGRVYAGDPSLRAKSHDSTSTRQEPPEGAAPVHADGPARAQNTPKNDHPRGPAPRRLATG